MPTATADASVSPTRSAAHATGAASPAIELADLQANVVRGYSAGRARHYALGIGSAPGASAFLSAILPDATGDGPKISTADHWNEKPPYCLTVGFTFAGLRAMGLPASLMALFPAAFQQGPASPADKVTLLGDTGESAPEHWRIGGPNTPDVHLMVSVYTHTHDPALIDSLDATLEAMFAAHSLLIFSRHDANALPDGKVHFGYRDSIGQPRIEGVPGRQAADMQPKCSPGEFLLGRGYVNQYNGNFLGDLPPALCDNATYAAFRLLEQDVVGFERFIELTGKRMRMDKELVAAKMMGRWRDGSPLTLTPDAPDPDMPASELDRFDYAPTAKHPAYFDDAEGMRCPVGAHARRLNPRSGRVMGKPYSRRIIRRAIAYGPAYDPAKGDDGIERGLVGFFICGDLSMQYEFLLGTWANMDLSAVGLRGTRDPILGAQPPEGGQLVIRTQDSRDPIIVSDLPRLVTTRGSVYCMFPGIGGLRFLVAAASA